MTKRKQRAKKRPAPAASVLLDRFTEEQLDDWSRGGEILQGLADKVYFELERQRATRYAELCDALRSSPSVSVNVDHWCRVTDWQWNLTPFEPQSNCASACCKLLMCGDKSQLFFRSRRYLKFLAGSLAMLISRASYTLLSEAPAFA